MSYSPLPLNGLISLRRGTVPTNSYRNAQELGFGGLWQIELARGTSGKQRFWWPAVVVWRKNNHREGWFLVGEVNAGGPTGGIYQKVHAHGPEVRSFHGHAPDTETGIRIMLAILKEFYP